MNARRWMRTALIAGLVSVGVAGLGSCAVDRSALGQLEPGQTVYADLWDEDESVGDQALVERKPSGLYIVDLSAPFRSARGDGFDVKVTLDDKGVIRVVDMGNTLAGKDQDNCLSLQDHEHYAVVDDNYVGFEEDVRESETGSDDCVMAGTR